MNPAIKQTEPEQPGAHLRLVSDRAGGAASGITLSSVSKTYRSRDGDVPSLKPLDFDIKQGEFFVVVGPSGCGKSTLLKLISGLLPPTTGEIQVEGASSPEIIFSRVDLPQPDGPTTTKNSPSLMWKSSGRSDGTSPSRDR